MSKKQISDTLRLVEYCVISTWLYICAYDFYMVLLGVFALTLATHYAKTQKLQQSNYESAAIYAIIVVVFAMAGYCTFLFSWADLLAKILTKVTTFVYWSLLTE